jgi:hypothetical protein
VFMTCTTADMFGWMLQYTLTAPGVSNFFVFGVDPLRYRPRSNVLPVQVSRLDGPHRLHRRRRNS